MTCVVVTLVTSSDGSAPSSTLSLKLNSAASTRAYTLGVRARCSHVEHSIAVYADLVVVVPDLLSMRDIMPVATSLMYIRHGAPAVVVYSSDDCRGRVDLPSMRKHRRWQHDLRSRTLYRLNRLVTEHWEGVDHGLLLGLQHWWQVTDEGAECE